MCAERCRCRWSSNFHHPQQTIDENHSKNKILQSVSSENKKRNKKMNKSPVEWDWLCRLAFLIVHIVLIVEFFSWFSHRSRINTHVRRMMMMPTAGERNDYREGDQWGCRPTDRPTDRPSSAPSGSSAYASASLLFSPLTFDFRVARRVEKGKKKEPQHTPRQHVCNVKRSSHGYAPFPRVVASVYLPDGVLSYPMYSTIISQQIWVAYLLDIWNMAVIAEPRARQCSVI